jgi:excisionase family DNA binding protein
MAAHITGRDETSVHTTVIFCVLYGFDSRRQAGTRGTADPDMRDVEVLSRWVMQVAGGPGKATMTTGSSTANGQHEALQQSAGSADPLADLPELMTVAEVAPLLRMRTSTAYAAIKRGAFPVPVVRVGGRMLVSRFRLVEWLRTAGE